MKKHIELLAPVGSMDALYAAVQNGADAVYLGGKLFNARQYASNFDYDELKDAVSYAHLNNVRVYITVNILIDNNEMEDILDYIRYLYEINVDALIVQDLGLASLVRKVFPQFPIHGSTQMTINNLWGAKYLEEMGFTRVVLARETSIEEIQKIKENTFIELEGFIHGALCVSYSGQCLMSSMIGGRSGNRGRCAQPCRMAYSIANRDGNLIKGWENKYILSTRDLNTIENIGEIINSGITSLKIEGRMKRPEYVATIAKNYRKALDQGSDLIDSRAKQDIGQIFNREFTKGLGLGDFGRNFISSDRPDNRGIVLGRLVKADKYNAYVYLEEDLDKDDGIEFTLANGEYKGLRSSITGKRGSTIKLEKPGYINKDSLVYKTSSKSLLEEARESYQKNKKTYPLDMEVFIKIGQEAKLNLNYKEHTISNSINEKVERAQNLPLEEDRVRDQLGKLGDTVFHLHNFKANIEDGAFLPLSSINELRRKSIEDLNKILININQRKVINNDEFKENKKNALYLEKKKSKKDIKLNVRVTSLEQFNQLDLNKLDRVYLGFTKDLEKSLEKVNEFNKEAYIYTERILYSWDLEKLESLIRPILDKIDGISVSNLGTYKYIKDMFNLKIHGDTGLNIFNSYTANHLNSLGIDSLSLSPELNIRQINEITITNNNLESLVYGYLPVMVTKTCPMALVKGCRDDEDCHSCNFAKGYGLKDRMNMTFRMYREDGFTNIYNSVPLMVLDSLIKIVDSGISNLRMDFTYESDHIKELQTVFYDYIHGEIDDKSVKSFMDNFKETTNITNGHYFRGIL